MSSNRVRALALAGLCAMLAVASPARSDDAAAVPPGLKADLLHWISDAEDKLGQLAQAMPDGKYSWRPGKGVRSQGEVFLHVAAANYGVPTYWGVKPPEGFNFDTYEKQNVKKADIEKMLHDSFEHMKNSLASASDADLDKEIEIFGQKTTVRWAYILLLTHAHEHLGQSIAYARTNGVVPPWTAAQQAAIKAEKEKAASK
jgi:uncharacterized damage-inducible protein DinB